MMIRSSVTTVLFLCCRPFQRYLKKVAFDQLYDYFTTQGLLFNSQYWFRRYHSTELAALEFVDKIRSEIDQNKILFSVFLDLSKAFDTLDHDILLYKLNYYGVKDTALQWFKSYLAKRTQYIEYDWVASSVREIKTGVPQGSILGPLLFIICMDDIYTVSNKLDFLLYADDTTLSSPLCSFTHGENGDVNYVSRMINAELAKISDWLAVNILSLNASKTKFMVFHNYQLQLTENDIPQLMINNTIIKKVNEFNFLGLTINEFLKWRSHSAKISNKISHTLGVMNRLKRCLPFSAM